MEPIYSNFVPLLMFDSSKSIVDLPRMEEIKNKI